jgi:hypothetical protein
MTDVGDAREDRFLANRQQREQERAAARDESAAEEVEKRARFNTAIAEFEPRVTALLAEEGVAQVDPAMEAWREMQARVANAVQTIRLTAFDIRSANATLARVFNDIERKRATNDSESTRFRFTRGVKPVGSSFRDSRGVDTIGKQADACQVDEGPENALSDVTGGSHVIVEKSTARFIRRCEGSTIFLAPVDGSCFLSECKGCTVYVACHQMRINKCVDCEIYVWCRSTPVIERSQNVRFGGYSAWKGAMGALKERDGDAALASVEAYAHAAGLDDMDHARAAHRHVADFTWLKQQDSPNWIAMPESQWKVV